MSISSLESVGELAMDDEALDASDKIDSSLILVCNGTSTLAGRSSICFAASSTSCRSNAFVAIAPVDFEKGDSSIGVTVTREEGESKD
jgi:hypothetical protein